MSDITKKILSIESEFEPDFKPESTSAKDSLIRSVVPDIKSDAKPDTKPAPNNTKPASRHASDIPSLRSSVKDETYPDFISRKDKPITAEQPALKASPLSPTHNTQYTAEAPKTAWIMWTGLALTFIWIGASAAVYFGLFGAAISALTPMALSGLILAVILPAVLITLLWLTWRRLANMSYEAGRVAHAAQLLTRADETALINTRNLAVGIQSELSLVDEHLGKMLDRFEGLKNDITAHSQDINTVGLTLTERSDDVGRSLTLQRQALESITSTFDTRMETLGSTIETQSLKLSGITDVAAKNIETAERSLTQAAETLGKTGESLSQTSQDTQQTLESSAQGLSANTEQLSELHGKISDLISALTAQQDKVKSDLAAQSENLHDMSNMAKSSTDSLQQNLSLGSDLLTALSSTTQGTQDAVQKRFADMESMIGETQSRADAVADSANARVRNSLSQTRKDLSKLEADMQVLSTQITNAREQSAQLDLEALDREKSEQSGFGRLQLKPLETDFPPVEPPRYPAHDRSSSHAQAPLNFEGTNFEGANFEGEDNLSLIMPAMDAPINLGADMEIANPDAELTNFDPDVLRPAAPLGPNDRGFGKTRNNKEKAKSGWRWRDMLGGLERPDTTPQNIAPQNAPLSAPPMDMQALSDNIISRLSAAQLSPSAVVDTGTITEAAKARIKSGPATMLSIVDTRLSSPVAHLRGQFARDKDFQNTAKSFVTQYGQTIAQASPHDKSLRDSLGTSEGRAYLLCAAALS